MTVISLSNWTHCGYRGEDVLCQVRLEADNWSAESLRETGTGHHATLDQGKSDIVAVLIPDAFLVLELSCISFLGLHEKPLCPY